MGKREEKPTDLPLERRAGFASSLLREKGEAERDREPCQVLQTDILCGAWVLPYTHCAVSDAHICNLPIALSFSLSGWLFFFRPVLACQITGPTLTSMTPTFGRSGPRRLTLMLTWWPTRWQNILQQHSYFPPVSHTALLHLSAWLRIQNSFMICCAKRIPYTKEKKAEIYHLEWWGCHRWFRKKREYCEACCTKQTQDVFLQQWTEFRQGVVEGIFWEERNVQNIFEYFLRQWFGVCFFGNRFLPRLVDQNLVSWVSHTKLLLISVDVLSAILQRIVYAQFLESLKLIY